MERLEWTDFKQFVDATGAVISHVKLSDQYIVHATHASLVIYTKIDIEGETAPVDSDQEDFETNYLPESNKSLVDSEGFPKQTQLAFASKTIGDKKLYKRDTGVSYAVSAGSNTLDFSIPFNKMKVTGVEIIGAELGDWCDFEVNDTPTGAISTIPNLKLNQFGYKVYLAKDFYKRECQYDADVIKDMVVRVVYNSITTKTIYINYIIHEVK